MKKLLLVVGVIAAAAALVALRRSSGNNGGGGWTNPDTDPLQDNGRRSEDAHSAYQPNPAAPTPV